jgi:CRP/FNR family cyclic AMP-dependent transcriptional regulator
MPLTSQEKRAMLESVPLFRDCSAEVLDRLAGSTAEFQFAAGAPIVQQGQVGNGLYIVVSGGVSIVAGSDQLARLGPGDFFGELSVIDQQPRAASAYAVGETVCLALASWDLMAVLEQDPHVSINLLKGLAARLRAADAQLRH